MGDEHAQREIKYSIKGETILFDSVTGKIIGYKGTNLKVKIPESIGGISVTKIGNKAFLNYAINDSRLERIILPNSIKEIEDSAFFNCINLKKIVLTENITKIGDHAFEYCSSLEEVILPSKLNEIGNGAFKQCKSIKMIKFPKSLRKIGKWAFAKCDIIKRIVLPNSITELNSHAFENCNNLYSVALSNQLNRIAKSTFNNCKNLKILILSNSIKKIEKDAFTGTALTDIYFNGSKEDWNNIDIYYTSSINPLKTATIHFNSKGPEKEMNKYNNSTEQVESDTETVNSIDEIDCREILQKSVPWKEQDDNNIIKAETIYMHNQEIEENNKNLSYQEEDNAVTINNINYMYNYIENTDKHMFSEQQCIKNVDKIASYIENIDIFRYLKEDYNNKEYIDKPLILPDTNVDTKNKLSIDNIRLLAENKKNYENLYEALIKSCLENKTEFMKKAQKEQIKFTEELVKKSELNNNIVLISIENNDNTSYIVAGYALKEGKFEVNINNKTYIFNKCILTYKLDYTEEEQDYCKNLIYFNDTEWVVPAPKFDKIVSVSDEIFLVNLARELKNDLEIRNSYLNENYVSMTMELSQNDYLHL